MIYNLQINGPPARNQLILNKQNEYGKMITLERLGIVIPLIERKKDNS